MHFVHLRVLIYSIFILLLKLYFIYNFKKQTLTSFWKWIYFVNDAKNSLNFDEIKTNDENSTLSI